MAKYSIEDTTLSAIADAIRSKTGSADTIAVNQFPSAISALSTGGVKKTGTVSRVSGDVTIELPTSEASDTSAVLIMLVDGYGTALFSGTDNLMNGDFRGVYVDSEGYNDRADITVTKSTSSYSIKWYIDPDLVSTASAFTYTMLAI